MSATYLSTAAAKVLAPLEAQVGDRLPYVGHVDDLTLQTRDGLLVQTLQLAGFPFETAPDEELNYRKAIRVEPLKLVVSRGGAVLRELDVPAEKGWFRHEIELPEGTAPIDFVLTGPSPTDADFCFDPVIQTSRAEGQAP